MDEHRLRVDFGDGVSALDRTMRTIVMLTDGAIRELEQLGYRRGPGGIELKVHDEGLPSFVLLNGEIVYIVGHGVSDVGRLEITGKWMRAVEAVKLRGPIGRFFAWLFRRR